MKLINKIKSEKAQIADVIMFFIFIVFVLYFIILFTSMQFYFRAQKMVDGIVRDEVETIRTKGILTKSEYEDFLDRIGKFGNFNVLVVAELQDNAGVRAKWFDINSICGKPLKVGDYIKIFVESKRPPLFSELLLRNFMFGYNGLNKSASSFKMQSIASAMVCSDGYIKGVEVMNTINRYFETTPPSPPSGGIWLYTLDYTGVPINESPSKTVTTPVQITSKYTGYYDVAQTNPIPPRTTNAWIDYEGNYRMDIEVSSIDYSITKIYFTQLVK
ncbi:MAG: hypothetical protein ACM3UU_05985 [Ignavibacteriales bacterium]